MSFQLSDGLYGGLEVQRHALHRSPLAQHGLWGAFLGSNGCQVQRHDARTDAVAFQSHLFAEARPGQPLERPFPAVRTAQVAVMDSYVGQAKAALLLTDGAAGDVNYTVMPFGTAFGLARGTYQVQER